MMGSVVMKLYEWMVKPTPQTEWIEKRGILLWLAFYVGGLGGGVYLVSLYFNSLLGIFISWLIVVVLKGGFHILYLGHPLRFWRMFFRPQSSWISRGLIFVVAFIGLALIQLLLAYFRPGTGLETVVMVLAVIMAVGTSVYTGFVMNYVNGIQLWISSILPFLFLLCGVLGGFGVMLGIAHITEGINIAAVETGSMVLMIVMAGLIVIYLTSSRYIGPAGKESVMALVKGPIAPVFWIGVVLCGIIIPFIVSSSSLLGGEPSVSIQIFAILCEIIGGLTLRYSILKGGYYTPLIPVSP
jgi:formate-dependent nitrite reductase membrane component NrfD